VARIVLVADDSPTIQKRALGILKGEGFEVETVSNGVAAIKRLAVLRPTVILADVSMPGRDGYEVCEFVKKSAELSQVPVLLVASDMEPYDDARGAQVRADGIITKPFEAQDLIDIVVKFAEQFEAAVPPVPVPAVAPTAAVRSTQEFAAFSEEPDEMPTVVQQVQPDFSAASEGVAFAEPAGEEAPGYSPEPFAAEMEVPPAPPQVEAEIVAEPAPAPEYFDTLPAPEPQSAPAEETPLAVEEPPSHSPYAPPPPPSPARTPSFLSGLEAATPEPVFIEEQSAPAPEPAIAAAEFRTMIFRAPLEIAEPVWKDETVPAPPPPEPAGPTSVQPQLEAEAAVASPQIPVEQPHEHPHTTPAVAATSLDSFSLDDAAAGQVRFASEAADIAPVEVAHSEPVVEAPAVEAPAAEIAPPEPAPEVDYSEAAPPETSPEVDYSEAAPPETLPEVDYSEAAPPETSPEVAYSEAAPPETLPEVGYSEAVPPETLPEVGYSEAAPPETLPEVAYSEAAPPETSPEVAYSEAAPPETLPEVGSAETALPEAQPEAVPAEAPTDAAAPLPAFDWGLVYAVVHKVVLRMSPPAFSTEAVEEVARRLADEIATEIATESSQPPE
jgi:CheY-like chemotaxis protein